MVGDLYENREGQTIAPGTLTRIENPAVERLLSRYRPPVIA